MKTLAQLVREVRTKAALSISDFAAEMDVSPRTISFWESGHLFPRTRHLEALCLFARAHSIVFDESGWSLAFQEQAVDNRSEPR